MPYIEEDVAPMMTSYKAGFETMAKLIEVAEKHSQSDSDFDHPLYNPRYEAQTKELIKQLGCLFPSRTWEDVCFAVRMYLFAMM